MRAFCCLLLLPLLLAPAAAFAAGDAPAEGETFPGRGAELGARAVWYEADDSDRATWNPGVQARWHFSRYVAVEGSADYQRHHFPDTTAHTLAAQASLLAYLRPGRLAPFLLAGGGWYLTRVNGPDLRRNLSRFGPHVGVGAQLLVNGPWSLDATYRYVWLEDIHTRDAATLAPRDFRRSGSMITIALDYALPGK